MENPIDEFPEVRKTLYKRHPLTREQVYRLLREEDLGELEPGQVVDCHIYRNSDT